ncbi:MAG: hypothetical protein LAQ30_17760 [Acidobacteriia bacterium]|nr:hypothetical protein [Terriglobia bacterium]
MPVASSASMVRKTMCASECAAAYGIPRRAAISAARTYTASTPKPHARVCQGWKGTVATAVSATAVISANM